MLMETYRVVFTRQTLMKMVNFMVNLIFKI